MTAYDLLKDVKGMPKKLDTFSGDYKQSIGWNRCRDNFITFLKSVEVDEVKLKYTVFECIKEADKIENLTAKKLVEFLIGLDKKLAHAIAKGLKFRGVK